MELLRTEHLCKVYGTGENQVHALRDVSFSVEKGEFVAIIGQSGSGKSTLLHMIGGVDVPSSGHVWVDGSDVYARNRKELAIFRRRQVGLIYQFYNLIPVLNVVDNMTLPVKLDGQKVNPGTSGRAFGHSGFEGQGSPSAETAVRRPAAEGSHRQGAFICPCPGSGR